ncbi:MAG: nitrate ABC transporter substrate-binding protein [Salinicola sp.]|mgnify:CR=1 FL=1|uniref:ABC transporter substrate-binding protein n=1 Tax=uncultured Salinicola sp. TaxID=1193542 RepID=UPI000C965FC3|nr:ABC transporter substrate-binding protein [uncultured Salinicola sp.]MAM58453.1 nitrate ABC transporter substrate-binding protein [Salinicola sp.]
MSFRLFFGRLKVSASLGALAIAVSGLAISESADAETLRIAEQYGLVYLPLHVIRDQGLLEKKAEAAGIDLDVEWVQLSGGANVNSALLSDSIDIASAGVGPLLTAWDRTRGSLDVKAFAALGEFPNDLVTNNPDVETLEDFGPGDKIAVPAVTVSVQSRLLQMAVAKAFGDDQYDRLDDLTVSLPHPDATAALISGGTEISAHFSNIPYQYQELEDPDVHRVLSSYDIVGGPITPTLIYARSSFFEQHPKVYGLFLEALEEADQFIGEHPTESAKIYRSVTDSKLEVATLESIITDPKVRYTPVPRNTYPLAEFLHRVGAIHHQPADWLDYFVDDASRWEGS